MTSDIPAQVDVLVVGAGPTGLMLANQLMRRGVRPLIIDRHAGPSRETRALGVHARTLEIYARLGVVDRALEWGKQGNGANMWADGKRMARIPLGDAGRDLTPYPYILVLGQDDNERILGDRLNQQGLAVQWNCELAGFEQARDHVIATLTGPDGATRQVRAAWVAGCDGARSVVREHSGIGFPGAPYEHVFFVADVQMTGTMVPDELNVYLWQEGFHLLFPMRGERHWRIVGILPPALRHDGVRFEDLLPSIREAVGDALDIQSCSWFSTYRIHHRAAERFRERRCFLLGDAAHIHSPVGAQGMNTGLQDAYNLAWKLALVVQGRADVALLDSYAAERLPVAQRLLATTDRAFKFIVSDSAVAGLLRTRVLARLAALAMSRPGIQAAAFRTVSQLAIEYRDSALSVGPRPWPGDAPHAGDRFPWLHLHMQSGGPVVDLFDQLDDTRFTLLLFGAGEVPMDDLPAFGDSLQVHRVPSDADNDAELARHDIAQPSFFLLRPDGYVGLCGHHFDTDRVARYAADVLRLESAA
jgi:2-polyprenyl-6-methoxyphenol hydroxylase-like FAD-dependent oxidoreductase